MLERLRQRGIAGIVRRGELRGIPVEAGDAILRDRDSLVVIPAALVETVAEEAAEAIAFEEFTADQVARAAASTACTSRAASAPSRPSPPGAG